MKIIRGLQLLVCPFCMDIVLVRLEYRACLCGQCAGWFDTVLNSFVVTPEAQVLAVEQNALIAALTSANRELPIKGKGKRVDHKIVFHALRNESPFITRGVYNYNNLILDLIRRTEDGPASKRKAQLQLDEMGRFI
jgi:hypothetical protein